MRFLASDDASYVTASATGPEVDRVVITLGVRLSLSRE